MEQGQQQQRVMESLKSLVFSGLLKSPNPTTEAVVLCLLVTPTVVTCSWLYSLHTVLYSRLALSPFYVRTRIKVLARALLDILIACRDG